MPEIFTRRELLILMTLLLRTLTGSRLYGTHHESSDYDWYEVHDQCKPFHSAHGASGDVTRWPLSMFMKIADKGGHNALDLMFSPPGWPEVDLLSDLRMSYRADPWRAYPRYLKTIESFESQGTVKGDLHAARMRDNLDSLMRTGRYNPRWRIQ